VYAIVRCGGRQEKASVDDVLTVDRLNGEVGSTLTLPAVLVVDGDNVVTDPEELGGYQVAAEIIGDATGPKITIIRFKNKTGYRRRLGHRQHYTQVKITGISKDGKPAGKSASASRSTSSRSTSSRTTASKSAASKAAADKPAASKPAAAKAAAAKGAADKGTAEKAAGKSTTSRSTAAKSTASKTTTSKTTTSKTTTSKGTASKAESAKES